jgi:hypothetical protein
VHALRERVHFYGNITDEVVEIIDHGAISGCLPWDDRIQQFAGERMSKLAPTADPLLHSTHIFRYAINATTRELGLPGSMETGFQGAALAFEASLANQLLLILAAIVTVYIVLGVLYESYIHPVTILSTLPSAGMGALLALMLFDAELDVIATKPDSEHRVADFSARHLRHHVSAQLQPGQFFIDGVDDFHRLCRR